MRRSSLYVTACLVVLGACTAQEKHVVKELEDLPGITCDFGDNNEVNATNCHPDQLGPTDPGA
ncbi:hypothetical protein [Alcaligenes endophyticus]|uniref:Secreted protein n=1 Tax=Alcaligenes endophyticus TaxID=1929088 RepID=A0ABT8EJ63_9BURK|nr:hypothetical protein [Alcaligenes endophyticus]MCX5591650.1 hypothetical protein [Alcaligenes endophyticus]MDN4121328.1 hypothetical protein [Alcaligenes endophyticus]